MVRPVTDDDIGLKVLREAPAEATQIIDIVAIHGIGAHPDDSWCKNVGTTESPQWVNWLNEEAMLPAVAPQARIMRYGYQSQWFGEGAMRQNTSTVAQRLLLALKRKREEYLSRPLIFIAHCFGGLVVLKALVDARHDEVDWPRISTSTTGLVFFGTPFRGVEGMSQVEMLEAARREYQEDELQPEVLKILEPGNEFLQEVVDQFGKTRRQANKVQVACFYELKSSNVGTIVGKENRMRFVVSESSGCIDLSDATSKFSLSRTHFNMNKFGNPAEEDFETVRDVVKNMVRTAHELVLARSQSRKSVSTYYHVPHIAVPRFFGRQKLISELHTFLLKPRGQYDKPNVVVLQALGGQGKSQIALELCRRLRKDCRGVFWLDATSKATLEGGFEELAEKLNQPAVRRLEDTESKIRFVLDTIQEWKEQWLMVYDNYDRPDVFKDIKQFLPERGQGGIICTSRHEATKVLGQQVQVPSMMNDGGIELLLRDMSIEDIESNHAVGEDIVRRLGGLALAIEQAAAYISFNRVALPDFINEYERKKAKVLKHMREELWEYQKLRDGSEQSEAFSAFTTWEMSFEQVERRDETRKDHITRFLNVAAFLEPSHIGSYLFETYLAEEENPFPWLDIFRRRISLSDEETDSDTDQTSSTSKCGRTSWSKDQFWSTIERLHRLSLVQSIENKPAVWFSIHPVISDWLQLRERKRSTRENILRETIELMSVVVGSSFAEAAHGSMRQELLAHLDTCHTSSQHIKLTKSLGCADMRKETNSFAYFYRRQGKYDKAEDLYDALLKEDRNSLDVSDKRLLTSMNNLALTYLNQGRRKEAEELEVQVIETRKRVFGLEHPDTLISMSNLASTYWNQGRWKEAEELEVQVIEISKRVLGLEHPSTLISMSNLASTYLDQGRWKEAEELFVQVIETSKRVLRLEHPDTLTLMNNLASTYRNQGRWKEAEELDVQVIEISKRVLGPEHPSTLASMSNLALTLTFLDQGRWMEAEELFVQVIETSKRLLRLEHPDTLASMGNLALTYRNQGRQKEAEELFVQVMEISKRVLGLEHPSTLTSMSNLALTYLDQGRWMEAEELEVQVIETSKRVLGLEHPDTLASMNNLALMYRNQGRWKEAEELFVQVIEISKRVLGLEHPDTLTSMSNLALTYLDQGRWKEAEELFVQVMETSKRVLGLEHPSTLASMNNLASTYRNQGRWKEAEELFVQVMEISKRVLGPEHLDTLMSMDNLALTYRKQGRRKEAEELFVQVMEISKRVLGPEHPDTLTS